MPTTRIGPLDFNHGLEDLEPVPESSRPLLPPTEALRPSTQGPASPVEELIHARSFGDTIDACIRPVIPDLSICRPERYGALLGEAQEILGDVQAQTGDPDIEGLTAVLDRQTELRDLLGYYVQSLLDA